MQTYVGAQYTWILYSTSKHSSELHPKTRSSKMKKIGDMVKQRLIKSNDLRRQYNYTTRANAKVKAVIAETEEGNLNEYTMRSCRDAARKMEDLLFSVGGTTRLVATLQYFRERPVVRELGMTKELLDKRKTGKYSTKEEQLQTLAMGGIEDFFSMFR